MAQDKKTSLTPSVRRGLAALAVIGLPVAASVAIAGLAGEPDLPGQGHVVSQAVLIEYTHGLHDGIAKTGADLKSLDSAMAALKSARVEPFVTALTPVYEDGYAKGASGEISKDQLGSYIAAASGAASVRDEMRAQAQKLAKLSGMDSADSEIFYSVEDFKGYAGVIEGDAAAEAAFMMLMTEVAHDDMRTAFAMAYGSPSMIKGDPDSFEGFLEASGISPASPSLIAARDDYRSLVVQEAKQSFPGFTADYASLTPAQDVKFPF